MDRRQSIPFETETTAQGEQTIMPGVRPISERERIEILMNGPIRLRRQQKPCNIGLFDEDARRQINLF